jgi:hypothetical protein
VAVAALSILSESKKSGGGGNAYKSSPFLLSALLGLGDRPDALFQCVRSDNMLKNKKKQKSKIAETSQIRVGSDVKYENKVKEENR